jgi:hypothetical protein
VGSDRKPCYMICPNILISLIWANTTGASSQACEARRPIAEAMAAWPVYACTAEPSASPGAADGVKTHPALAC